MCLYVLYTCIYVQMYVHIHKYAYIYAHFSNSEAGVAYSHKEIFSVSALAEELIFITSKES